MNCATSAVDPGPDAALHRLTRQGPMKQDVAFAADGVAFSSRFDGGSLGDVERVSANEFHVTLAEDAAATAGISTGYTTWFYFELRVEAAVASSSPPPTAKSPATTGGLRQIRLVLTNMNHQRGLFTNGYTVLQCVMDASRPDEGADGHEDESFFDNERRWRRLPSPIDVDKYTVPPPPQEPQSDAKDSAAAGTDGPPNDGDDDGRWGNNVPVTKKPPIRKSETKMRVAFTHHVQFARERVRFAFCYPYTFTKIQRQLATFDRRFQALEVDSDQHLQPQDPVDPGAAAATCASSTVYYHRDVITYSLGGLPVDLLTVSSRDHLLDTTETDLPGLYPHRTVQSRSRQFDLTKKRTVFITSRVHPGETPASFMLDGMLQLLLHPTDEGAASLRQHFVFKIIPVLNPDGVCQGFYRTDTRGVNLNRVYESPLHDKEPAVFASRALLMHTVEQYKERAAENIVFLDLHAHANHRGCFVYGNYFDSTEGGLQRQAQTQLFARLASLNCPYFDYLACSFDAENMSRRDARDNNNATTSREGCSRVALYRATGLTYVYTIECNYNEGRRRLDSSGTKAFSSRSVTSSPKSTIVRPKSEQTSQGTRRSIHRSTSEIVVGITRHVAPPGGRLFMKFTPLEWIDVGIGSLLALLDLFQLPSRTTAVQSSPFRTLEGVRKSILSDLKSADAASHNDKLSASPIVKIRASSSSSRTVTVQ